MPYNELRAKFDENVEGTLDEAARARVADAVERLEGRSGPTAERARAGGGAGIAPSPGARDGSRGKTRERGNGRSHEETARGLDTSRHGSSPG